MNRYARHLSMRQTPQSEPIPGREGEQVLNSAGGYVFAVDDFTRLDRFLILGNEGGTYYANERKLTLENAACVQRCLTLDPARTVRRIVEISDAGRAPKNDPAIFALALCASRGSPEAKQYALSVLPRVCRIPTHLFQFVSAAQELRGWGRGLRRAVADWYRNAKPRDLAYHVVKYQSRDGWSHRDLLRLSHPKAEGPIQDVLHYAVKGCTEVGEEAPLNETMLPIWAAERAKRATTKDEIVRLIREYDLVRECIPTQWLNEPEVWEALLVRMPLTAMIRNLGKMTAVGLLTARSSAANKVCETLVNEEALGKARLHPLSILVALKTYQQGHGDKGKLKWTPVTKIVEALDTAFYLAFVTLEPTGKRWMIGIDVSASMSAAIAGTPISCCEAATALSMVTAATERESFIGRFNTGFQRVPFKKGTRLDAALRHTRNINGGGTDCAMPMLFAMEHRMEVDTFVVLTDNETWAGKVHPCQALRQYRDKTGIAAKLIVNGMTATQFSIADPNDAGMLDVVGFDSATPAIMANFARD